MKTTIIGIALVASVSFCAFGGERVFLKCDETNPLRFEFSNVKYREFPMPGLKEAFAAIPPEDRPREFYIKCRAARLDGSVSWKVYANGNVSYMLPISQVGRMETLRIRPEIVSMRKTSGYDYCQLKKPCGDPELGFEMVTFLTFLARYGTGGGTSRRMPIGALMSGFEKPPRGRREEGGCVK